MKKSYSNLRSLLFVCAVFLLSNFYSFAVFGQCNPAANDPSFNPLDIGFGNGDGPTKAPANYNDGYDASILHTEIASNGNIVISGTFDFYNGREARGVANLKPNGKNDSTFTLDARIRLVRGGQILDNGKMIVRGWLWSAYNSTRILRLHADGTIDESFAFIMAGIGNFKVLNNEQIFVMGSFQDINGTPAMSLARLDAQGNIDNSFQSRFPDNTARISQVIEQPDGKIILRGTFTTYDGQQVNDIFRINTDGSLDTSFSTGTGFDSFSSDMKLQSDGKLVVVGDFENYNGSSVENIVRLDTNGNLDNSFIAPTLLTAASNPSLTCLAIQTDGKILVGGGLGLMQTTTPTQVIRLHPNGSIDNTFDIIPTLNSLQFQFDSYVSSIDIQSDGKIVLSRRQTDDYPGFPLIRVNSDGSIDNSFNKVTGFNDYVNTIAVQSDGKVLLGGRFTKYNGEHSSLITRVYPNGNIDSNFLAPIFVSLNASEVTKIIIQDDQKIIAVGKFNNYQGNSGIVRFNTDGSIDNTFQNPILGYNSAASDVAIQNDGKIIVSGGFYFSGGVQKTLLRLNTDGSIDNSFSPQQNFARQCITLSDDGKIYTTEGNRIVRLNNDGSLDNTFYQGVGFTYSLMRIYEIAIDQNDKLIVVGSFSRYNNVVAKSIMRLNNDGTVDNTFAHGDYFNNLIEDIYIQDNGKMIVGGHFRDYDGQDTKRLAVLNPDGTLDTSFDTSVGFNEGVRCITPHPSYGILVGGEFTSYNEIGRNRIARLRAAAPSSPSLNLQANTITGLCPNTQTTLRATGTGTLYWYDSPTSNTSIGTGDTLRTPLLMADSTYFYVQDSVIGCGSSPRLEILVTTSSSVQANAQNYVAYLDSLGQVEVNISQIDSLSSAGCGNTISSYVFHDTNLTTRTYSCTDTTTLHEVWLRVTDTNGNIDTAQAFIQVKDTIAPIIQVQDISFTLSLANSQTILARDFLVSLQDNCTDSSNINVVFEDTGLPSRTINCSNNRTNFVIKATDLSGNVKSIPTQVNITATEYDLGVNLVANPTFRPLITSRIFLDAYNLECLPASGQISVVMDNCQFISSAITPSSILGNVVTWNFENLVNNRTRFTSSLLVQPNSNVNIGDSVCFTVSITPTNGDINLANNTKTYCFPVRNSYDPNDKQVYPQGICDDKFTKRSDLPLTYTIRFQNTGNAPALNVNIVDSLSSLLNRRSLRVVGTSHPMTVDTVAGNNVINFKFDNINLLDSTSSPELSQGYVIFELDEIAAHTDTSRIENKSYIYFDTNAPIITNTVKNTIVNTLPICNPAGGGSNPPIADCQLPTNLRTEILTSTKVKLLWNTPATTNAINYEVLRNGQRLATIPSSNLSFVDSTLTGNTQYNYSIKAICGNSVATSNSVQVRTLPSVPVLLSVIAACKGETGKINVQSAGAVYRVYDSETSTTTLFETNDASIETPVLNDSTTFYISVLINGQESERLEVLVPIKEFFDAIVEQGSLLETCTTDFTLSAQEVEGATYTWFRENIQVGTERTFTTTIESRYKVIVIKNDCSDESEFITTRFVTAPTAKIEQGNSVTFCGNGTLNAQDTSSNVSYEWTLNGNTLGNGTSISISESGIYTLKASQPSCVDSVNIAVTITSTPTNVDLTADKTAICTSEETTLSATTGTGFTYKWFRNNTVISNTSASFSTSEIGTYKVEITTQDGCKVTTSEVAITEAQIVDAILTINQDNFADKTITVSSSDSIVSVVWFFNESEIADFNNQKMIEPSNQGNFKAKVTYLSGCEFETDAKIFTIDGITGIEEESAKIFTIYPNPNTGSFKVEFATTTNQKTNLVLIDGLGRTIHSQEISMNEKTTSITLPKISAGVYVVQIVSEGKVYTKQLIIQ